jgi:hypothetical protein
MSIFSWKRVLGGAALACAIFVAPAARAADDKPVQLITKPKVGRVLRTKSTIKMTLMGMTLDVHASVKSTVKSVEDNGDVVTEIVDEGGTVTANGMEQKLPPNPTYSETHNRIGKTIQTDKKDSDDGFTAPEVTKLMNSITDIVLTDKDVKPNDTWQNELDNPVVPAQKVLVKDVYLGIDKVDGKDCWTIKQTAEAIVDGTGTKLNYEVTEWIDPMNGNSVQLDGTINNVPTRGGAMTMHIVAKSSRLDEKAKSTAKLFETGTEAVPVSHYT